MNHRVSVKYCLKICKNCCNQDQNALPALTKDNLWMYIMRTLLYLLKQNYQHRNCNHCFGNGKLLKLQK